MDIEKTLRVVHDLFDQKNIQHALIGGMALATLGVNRTTYDVDMIIDQSDKKLAITSLVSIGFTLIYDSDEVCQLSGIGHLDLLLASRPISRKMLSDSPINAKHGIRCLKVEDVIGLKIQAYKNDPDREFQDKADIQALIKLHQKLDWKTLQDYAELFDEWEFLKKIQEN